MPLKMTLKTLTFSSQSNWNRLMLSKKDGRIIMKLIAQTLTKDMPFLVKTLQIYLMACQRVTRFQNGPHEIIP